MTLRHVTLRYVTLRYVTLRYVTHSLDLTIAVTCLSVLNVLCINVAQVQQLPCKNGAISVR